MKKALSILMCVLLLASSLTLFASGAAASGSAVLKTYDFATTLTEWGTGKNPAGVWSFEYWDFADNQFKLMAYWQDNSGINTYFEAVSPPDSTDDYYYARHRNGSDGTFASQMHPGNKADAVRTFVCPASGKIDYTVTVTRGNTVTTNDGNDVSVYLNDTLIWPTAAYLGRDYVTQEAVDNKCAYIEDNTKPLTIAFNGLEVKEGDKIRLRIGSGPANNKGSDVCNISNNIITYSTLAAGYTYTIAAPVASASAITDSSATLKWIAVAEATGYNVYLGGQKVNSSVITELTYALDKLTPDTTYAATVTAVFAGGESAPSSEVTVKTKAAAATTAATTTAAAVTTAAPGGNQTSAPGSDTAGSNAGDTTSADADKDEGGGLDTTTIIIIAAAAAVVVLIIIIIAVNASKKKKK